MTISDAEQRRIALDPNRSFAVAAPAGSGKTELLTQRVLRLLSTVDAPEEILCMTFTRKAAGEMRQRIIRALQQADQQVTDTSEHQRVTLELARTALDRDKALGWQLLQTPNRLRILTIDGFCLNLARQLPADSGFGDQVEPLDNPLPHYRQVIAELLLPALEQQSLLGTAVGTLLRHLDNDLNKLEQLLVELLQKREQWISPLLSARDAKAYLEQNLQVAIYEVLSSAHRKLVPFGSELASLADFAASQLPKEKQQSKIASCLGMTALPEGNGDRLEQWLGLCELLLTTSNQWRLSLNKNVGFPTDVDGDKSLAKARKDRMKALLSELREIPGLQDTLEDVRFLPYHTYPDNQWQALDALCQLLPTLAAALSLHFQQIKACDFTEITLAALRALGSEDDPSQLALRLDYQIKHILTDEFQDTSTAQFEILKQLTAGWQSNDGHSLFIVGDAMQSLYGFRNANVGLFLEARTQPIGQIQLEPLDLTVNFRSQAGIIQWINEHFPAVFPAEENIARGAVPYSPATAFHEAMSGSAVTLEAFLDYPDREAEAQRVVELVTEAKGENPDGSIAILVRNRTHLPEILSALRQAGHSWQTSDIDPLASCMPVIDLMSLTRALLSPADRIAWLSILRAPWCGLDHHDLLHLATTIKGRSEQKGFPLLLSQLQSSAVLEQLSTAGRTIMQRVAPVLVEAWHQRQRKPLRCWIEGTWEALGGPVALSSVTELEQCQQYLDLLETHDHAGTVPDWQTFERDVQALYATPDENADPHLHVMTIHKAKGLEFDTVIIPGLNRKPRNEDPQLLLWQERVSKQGGSQLLIAPTAEIGQDKDSLYLHLDRERKLKTRQEIARVLYVGMTRAIKRLHLLCTMKTNDEPVKNSLLGSLWPAIADDFTSRSESMRWYQYQGDNDARKPLALKLTTLKRLPPSWTPPIPTLPQGDNLHGDTPSASLTSSASQVKNDHTARHTGTVLHRILHQITLEGIERWSAQTVAERQPFWDIQLRQLGLCDTRSALSILQRAVINCIEDKNSHWIFDHSHPQSACEYALGYQDHKGNFRTAVIDRTFIRKGSRWIIDYKTAQPHEGQTEAEFLQHQQEQYGEQLSRYAQLLEGSDDFPIQCALYFPLIQKLHICPG
ncbi:UvrD-helicase domain-containing protein [Porticoccus sp.]